jgi:succinoglycan biosynthesis transport protein ExoP
MAGQQVVPAPGVPAPLPGNPWPVLPDEPPVPLSHYARILKRQCWKLLLFVACCLMATLAISWRITPIHESTATIDVDNQMPAGVIGLDAVRAMTNDVERFLATQASLIESDAVLRPVARQYDLLKRENPFPGESALAYRSPVVLNDLKVTRVPGTFLLLISYRSRDSDLAAEVANAIAKSYIERTYQIRYRAAADLSAFMERQLAELKSKMERSGRSLAQVERELNVINPEQKISTLSVRLLQLNAEYATAQADRVRKEAALESVRTGSMESAQVAAQGGSLRGLSERLGEAQQRFGEIQTRYGDNHPEYKKAATELAELQRLVQRTKENITQRAAAEYREAASREFMLQKAVAETKTEFDRLNARSIEYQASRKEAEADKKLYEELVHKIKEAGINAGFQSSTIRIADLARPSAEPIYPNVSLNLLVVLILSSLVAVAAAVTSDIFNNTVRDPARVSRALNAPIVGGLPVVKEWRGVVSSRKTGDRRHELYEDAIRMLRNSILLSEHERRLRSLMVSSVAESEGKSTVAAHLAIAHAQLGRKTLLIDGDLCRPSARARFDIRGAKCLCDIAGTATPWRDLLKRNEAIPNLDILLAGCPDRSGADLIVNRMIEMLPYATQEYDLIVLDSSPLLGFAESWRIAAAADGVLLVALAGRTNHKALVSVLTTLERLRAHAVGVVLNEVRPDLTNGYYYQSDHRSHFML